MQPMAVSHSLPAQAADVTSFEDVYRAHRHQVLGWALRFTAGRRDLAEDLAQEVFLRLHRRLPRLDTTVDLGGWLYRVTANAALSHLRRERFSLRRLARLVAGRVRSAASAEDTVVLQQDAAAAVKALGALPDRERVVACMHFLDGLAQRDIARTLTLSEGYVSKLLTRARERLRGWGWEVPDDQA
jgi:RNA polymerase sigma-70 factor (ECF subfamily)